MSRKDHEDLSAWLNTDPAMRAAWDEFRAVLDRVSGQIAAGQPSDLDQLNEAAMRVRRDSGEDQTQQ